MSDSSTFFSTKTTQSTMFLAQTDIPSTVTGAASSLLSGRSDTMVILVGFLAFAGLYLWYVHIPRQESERKLRDVDKEIVRKQADTLEELTKVTTNIHATTIASGSTIKAMMEVKELEIECIDKIANSTQCDIKDNLAEMRGVIRAVKAGATT